MLANSKTLNATTHIQKWWKKLLMTIHRCRKGECRKMIPYANVEGQLCEECYAERYHPEYGWDNENYKYYN